jgi:uncharacterized protein YkwD
MYIRNILFIAFFTTSAFSFAQTTQVCVTPEEMKLYNLIMTYRAEYGLPEIPLSKSLSYVAHQHAWDLEVNEPTHGECNMHSWSAKGPWTPCCYTPDHKQAKGMWGKPKELTTYQGYGFEISCGSSAELDAEESLESWQGSEHHNDVILNKDIWKPYTWNAIGIAIYGKYAVVWFGKEVDEAGAPELCK